MDAKTQKLMNTVQVLGGTFIGLDTLTNVTLRGGKANPMQGRVTKRVTGSQVMVFSNSNKNGYNEMVKRRLAQESKDPESFVLQPMKWGERVPETPFIENKGQYYLQCIFLKAGGVEYLLDGNPIAKEDIEGLKEPEVKPESQAGLDNKVIVRAYKVASITGLRANGQTITF